MNLSKEEVPPELKEILIELNRATSKFPTWPTDPLHALAVLGEEFGELTQAILKYTYEPSIITEDSNFRQHVKEEAIQCAAMALRFVMSLDKYVYEPSEQHKQK